MNKYFTCICYFISENLCFLFYSTLFYSCCETRLLLYIFSTICTKLHWLHDTFHDDAFYSIPWKTLRPKFLLSFKIFEMSVFPIEKCSANFQQPILGCYLHNPKWQFFDLDPNISISVQQITDTLRVTWVLMRVYKIKTFMIFRFEQTQNFKRFECINSKLFGNRLKSTLWNLCSS